ncbi:MAG: hypothetical protein HY096_07125 [Nitrospinae bacterium]|nr:hypothetical protein [Nitrospinota bacterium]
MWKKIASLIIGFSLIILSSYANGGEEFLSPSEYWERPIPLQIPNSNSELPLSFHPEDCGECHKEQYKGWKGSLHSKAVGPGLLSQLEPHNDPEIAVSCYYCHAPMMEQSEVGSREHIKNPYFDNKLKLSGISCSVCHVRKGKVYGPPARAEVRSEEKKWHSGFIVKDFFQSAEFCAACHQLDEGYELNGKVLTNTYKEWKNSFYGKSNITCQNCHMPDRQHFWKGIHDPEMVRDGISIETYPNERGAKLVITNSGVGHFFPTYVTPLIVVKGFMLDNKGKLIPSSMKESFIGRKVSLDLTQEFFDTRIAPQKSFEFDYNQAFLNGNRLIFKVWVYPDKFYNEFFENMLKGDNIGIKNNELEEAWKNSSESSYLLWKKEINTE